MMPIVAFALVSAMLPACSAPNGSGRGDEPIAAEREIERASDLAEMRLAVFAHPRILDLPRGVGKAFIKCSGEYGLAAVKQPPQDLALTWSGADVALPMPSKQQFFETFLVAFQQALSTIDGGDYGMLVSYCPADILDFEKYDGV